MYLAFAIVTWLNENLSILSLRHGHADSSTAEYFRQHNVLHITNQVSALCVCERERESERKQETTYNSQNSTVWFVDTFFCIYRNIDIAYIHSKWVVSLFIRPST